jgi:alpha-L-fucosidase
MIIMATIGTSAIVHAGEGARTDWFKDAGYGLFCCWHSQSVNADGSKKDYYIAVREFDVNAFANQVDEAGAKFVIFTLIHGRHELAFPSAVMDSICPGHTTTQRDLYADMYTALNAKGIRMMFYWNMHATKDEPDWHDGSKWATDKAYFVQKQYDLVEEIGNRYGNKLAGWWLDHCYDNDPRLPADVRNWGAKYDFAKYAAKLRAGNTNRIVTFNFRWKFWGCDWGKGIMDYQAGEDGLENNWIPASRFAGEGGTQWFACDATDDPNWMHVKPGVVKPRYATDRVISYIQNVISNQGVFAYNCAMYNNGKIAEDTMVQLRAVKQAIRGVFAAPTALTATALNTNQIQLAWTDSATNETGYVLDRSLEGSVWNVLTSLAANASAYVDDGLAAGTRYYYRLAATNSTGRSAYATASATTFSNVTCAITAPVNGAVLKAGVNVTIAATASARGGTVSKIEFFRDGVKLGEDTSDPYTCEWTNVVVGTYALTARATDSLGATGDSAVVSVQVGSVQATGGTVTNYTLNGTNWTAHIFASVCATSLSVTVGGHVEVLVVAGGGGGSSGKINNWWGGGGGGGQVLTGNSTVAAGSNYTIVVGTGGVYGAADATDGGDGSSSSFDSIAATGGKGGKGTTTGDGGASGSGKLGGARSSYHAGGGGGDSQSGVGGIGGSTGGDGGNGTSSSISGSSSAYGGGGGAYGGRNGTGGSGGGGDGNQFSPNAGTPNTGGGGGGGGGATTGGNGGSGIVIVRYVTAVGPVAPTGFTATAVATNRIEGEGR